MSVMPQIPNFMDMLQAGVHFGHKRSRWHPHMKPYVFGLKNDIYIINLEQTVNKLVEACDFVRRLGKEGKIILFIGTKKQAQTIVKEAATRANCSYVTERWLGGTFTNFNELYKNLIKKYLDLKQKRERGELTKYTKREQLGFDEWITKMEKKVGGISSLTRIPDAIFIIDAHKEATALKEARAKGVPIVALCDTDNDPEIMDYPIPCNDDGIKSLTMMVGLITDAYIEGKAEREIETSKSAEPQTTK